MPRLAGGEGRYLLNTLADARQTKRQCGRTTSSVQQQPAVEEPTGSGTAVVAPAPALATLAAGLVQVAGLERYLTLPFYWHPSPLPFQVQAPPNVAWPSTLALEKQL